MCISNYKGTELLEQLNSGKFSVLKSLGADDMLAEIMPAGKTCIALTNFCTMTKDDAKIAPRAVKILRSVAPAKIEGTLPQFDHAIVIGFNHPTLGEIFRILYMILDAYPGRQFLFPVNIPWYESIVPAIPKLKRAGVNIVPMITPSTEIKLSKKAESLEDSLLREQRLKDIQYLKTMFERNYMRASKAIAEQNGIIVSAPSATRQAVVIAEHVHPTMTLLAHMALKKENAQALFVPITVNEPANGNRNLNLFRTYRLHICEPFETAEIRELASEKKEFDYAFLKRIEKFYHK